MAPSSGSSGAALILSLLPTGGLFLLVLLYFVPL